MNLPNLLRKISLRHLRLRKAQMLMSCAGICLGVAAIVSIGIIKQSVLHSFEESIIQVTGRASLQVTGAQSGFSETLVERVGAVPGVEYAVPAIETDGLLAEGKERSIMILGVDVLVDTQVRDYSLSGDSADIPDPLLFLARPDSILITREMAKREGISLDQKIRLQTVRGIRTFRVRGILDPTGPAKAMGGNVAIMDIYAAQMAFGMAGSINRIDVSLRRGEDIESVRERIVAALPKGYLVDTPAARTRQVETMLSKFQNGCNLISFLAIFSGMYLIYNAVAISVVQRKREIGVMRALGASRGDMAALFLSETLVLSIIGASLGVGFGLLLADAMVGAFARIISGVYAKTAVTEIHFTWFYPLVGFTIGILASLAAAYFPARASSRVSPLSAIRSVPFTEEGIFTSRRMNIAAVVCVLFAASIFAIRHLSGHSSFANNMTLLFSAQLVLILGISLFTPAFLKCLITLFHRFFSFRLGVTGRLAGLNLLKNITRNAVAVAAVSFGISIFVSTAGLVLSVKESIIDWVEAVNRADLLITSGHPMSSSNAPNVLMPASMGRELEAIPGVLSADPWRKLFMNYRGRRVLLSSADIVRRAQYGSHLIPVAHGDERPMRDLLPNRDNVAVSESFATIFGVKPHDRILLPTPSGEAPFTVVAVVVDYTSDIGTIVMDIHTYERHWKDVLADTFSVHLSKGAKIQDVRQAIEQRFGADRKLFVLPSGEFKNEIRKALDGMFIFNYALNIITLTIACLGIIVTLFSSVLERTREISILRSIGMLRSQISWVVLLESSLMGLAGGLLGSATGIVTGWLELEGFFVANYGSAAKYYIPIGSILWALIISALLSALAGSIPARRAAKTGIVEALAYE